MIVHWLIISWLEYIKDMVIKNIIVFYTNENAFRERLMRESDLTLPIAISAGHATDETKKHARSSSPNLPPTFTKLINFVNLITKLPMKNQNRWLRKCKFRNRSHQKIRSMWKVVFKLQQKKWFQSSLSPKSKIGTKIEQTESDSEEYFDLEFCVQAISIKDPLNTNKIKNENSV